MLTESYKIFPLGVDALTVEFGNEISVELNEKSVNITKFFEENHFPGFIETVPAYASLTIFYDVFTVKKNFSGFSTAFEAVRFLTEKALQNSAETPNSKPRKIQIPVNFSKEFAFDLDFVAASNNLSPDR